MWFCIIDYFLQSVVNILNKEGTEFDYHTCDNTAITVVLGVWYFSIVCITSKEIYVLLIAQLFRFMEQTNFSLVHII